MSDLATESTVAARRAPDAVAPPPGNPRFPLFDGLRAIAALSIVVTHVSGFTGFNEGNALGAYTARLNMGVALFFVISGFLLYRPFLAARLEGRPVPRIRDYARRRVLRIVPAYWVALTILAATVGLCGVFGSGWWRFYLFAQVYDQATVICGIGAAWSLAIEASFYVALPLWALLMWRLQRGRSQRAMVRIELAALLAISLVSIVARTWSWAAVHHQTPIDTTLLGNADWFGWGMLLALASVALRGSEGRSRTVRVISERPWLPWLGALFLLWLDSTQLGMARTFPPLYTSGQWLEEHLLFPAIGFLLALPAVFGEPGRGLPRRILGNRVLMWLGLVSYGIFLYHQPLLDELARHGGTTWLPGMPFVGLLLELTAAATAAAALSYYLLERPILRFKDRRPRPESVQPATAPATAG